MQILLQRLSASLFAHVQRSRVWLQLLWVSSCEPTSAYGVFRLLTYFCWPCMKLTAAHLFIAVSDYVAVYVNLCQTSCVSASVYPVLQQSIWFLGYTIRYGEIIRE